MVSAFVGSLFQCVVQALAHGERPGAALGQSGAGSATPTNHSGSRAGSQSRVVDPDQHTLEFAAARAAPMPPTRTAVEGQPLDCYDQGAAVGTGQTGEL